jgi:hypothetical protein
MIQRLILTYQSGLAGLGVHVGNVRPLFSSAFATYSITVVTVTGTRSADTVNCGRRARTLILTRDGVYYRGYSIDAEGYRSMSDRSYRDTSGILIVFGITLSAAGAADGIAQGLLVLVGAVNASLWIGSFVPRGYADAPETSTSD